MGSPVVATLGQQYNVGERPTVILYTYINRHARPSGTTKQNTIQHITKKVVIIYEIIIPSNHTAIVAWVNSKMSGRNTIEPYNNRWLGQK